MTIDLKIQIEKLKNSKLEVERLQCIPLLKEYLSSNQNDVVAWYDLAGCYDFCGYEKDAEPCYWKTYELGWTQLPAQVQAGFFVCFGSTLRNNLKFNESEKILSEALIHFPNYNPLKVFLSFTLYSQHKYREAARVLFDVTQSMPEKTFDGFEKAIKWYVDNIDTHPEEIKK